MLTYMNKIGLNSMILINKKSKKSEQSKLESLFVTFSITMYLNYIIIIEYFLSYIVM